MKKEKLTSIIIISNIVKIDSRNFKQSVVVSEWINFCVCMNIGFEGRVSNEKKISMG